MSVCSRFAKRVSYPVFVGFCVCITAPSVLAEGGMSIHGTRVVYPQNAKQRNLSVSNSSETDSFLVQSWIEDASGHKTNDFIVTPPLYLSGPKNENTLRLIYTGRELPHDRESLYYFTSKAIPSIDESKSAGKNVIRIALASRIKVFVRPNDLNISPDDAPNSLEFHQNGDRLNIKNPTPYYITLTDMKIAGKNLEDTMVPPKGMASETVHWSHGGKIAFRTLNDFGAKTKEVIADVN